MTDAIRLRRWRAAALGVLLLWLGAVLTLNGTGHLSVDSVVQMVEGRSGVMTSFHPVFITVLFGKLANIGGPRLLVICSSLMLFAALLGILPGTQRPRFIGVALLACALVGPIMLIYPAIVWKDVWLAHFALLGFALIAVRHRVRWSVVVAGSLLLFAAAMLSRPNGAIVAVCGAATLGYARWSDDAFRRGMPRRLRQLTARVAVYLGLLLVMAAVLAGVARLAVKDAPPGDVSTGTRLLIIYDIAGMIVRVRDPDLSLLAVQGVDPAAMIEMSRSSYSDERIDLMDWDRAPAIWTVPTRALAGQWFSLAATDPAAYLGHRTEVFSQLLGLHDQMRCVPVHVGYSDPELAARAGFSVALTKYAYRLYRYSLQFVNTPYFSPAAWALGSVATLAMMAMRRRYEPAIAGLQIAALAYLGAYFFISIACDFRYAYFSALGGTIGVIWLVTGGLRRPTGGPARPPGDMTAHAEDGRLT